MDGAGWSGEIPRKMGMKTSSIDAKGDMAMAARTFMASIHKEEDLYVALCPEVGTASQGDTVEDALANLKEATELYLRDFPVPEAKMLLFATFEATYTAREDYKGVPHAH